MSSWQSLTLGDIGYRLLPAGSFRRVAARALYRGFIKPWRRPQYNFPQKFQFKSLLNTANQACDIVPPGTLFSPCYRGITFDSRALPLSFGWNGQALPLVPFPLTADKEVTVTFACPFDNLTQLGILVGTHDRVNNCDISLSLYEYTWDDGKPPSNSNGNIGLNGYLLVKIASVEIDGQTVKNNKFLPFILNNPLINAKGRWFKLSITSQNASINNSLSVWGSLIDQESSLFKSFKTLGSSQVPSIYNYKDTSSGLVEGFSSMPQFPKELDTDDLSKLSVTVVTSGIFLNQTSEGALTEKLIKSLMVECGQIHLGLTDSGCDVRMLCQKSDIVIFVGVGFDLGIRNLITQLRQEHRISILLDAQFGVDVSAKDWANALPLSNKRELNFTLKKTAYFISACDFHVPIASLTNNTQSELKSILERYRKLSLPKVTIVTVLYRKERELPYFLESIGRQNYRGEIEIVMVDDHSPDNSSELAQSHAKRLSQKFSHLNNLKILKTESNSGNCVARHLGIRNASGEVIVVVDADCLLNRDFIASHVEAHKLNQADVVVGYFNLESGSGNPIEALITYEENITTVEKSADIQDSVNRSSFLNCITRNFSIRREFITEPLFDDEFAYSARADSGFGWEDIEMGYRLYQRGARIHFDDRSFSLHVSHPPSVEEKTKPLRSIKNFRRLLEKHPDFALIARRWTVDTFQKICSWASGNGLNLDGDFAAVSQKLSQTLSTPLVINSAKKFRVLTYRWHCPHQYELYKTGHDFTLVRDLGTAFTANWNCEERPLPSNAKMAYKSEVNFANYDLAIIHFDENVLNPENCNGVIGPDWGANFKWCMQNLPIPKVAICHGTPQFYGQYHKTTDVPDFGQTIEYARRSLVEFLGHTLVILNSYQAQKEWGFKESRVIWQGFDPTEFPVSRYERKILSLGRSIEERPYYRGHFLFKKVINKLPLELHPESLDVPEPVLFDSHSNDYARLKYRNYIDALRKYSIYFNPTKRSPMPRARGEAMMCGLVPVSARNHDVEMFISNGWNGFFSDNPDELAEYLTYLSTHESTLKAIGARARATALDLFNHDRYLAQWQDVINAVAG